MSNEAKILDKVNYGTVYVFVPSPVWYSVSVDLPKGFEAKYMAKVAEFSALQSYLDQVYEAARAGNPTPEVPPDVKEFLWPQADVAKQDGRQKRKGSAAASNSESQSS